VVYDFAGADMKPTIINILTNVVVRDYIQHWWQVALDIVNLNSEGKNKYELRREAEQLILYEIDKILKEHNVEYRSVYRTIESSLGYLLNVYETWSVWSDFLIYLKKNSNATRRRVHTTLERID
jgi:hypothetical protein